MKKSILYSLLAVLSLCMVASSCKKTSKGDPKLEAPFEWNKTIPVVGSFDGTVKVTAPNGIEEFLVTVTLPNATYVQLASGMINIKAHRPSAKNLKAIFDLMNDDNAASSFGVSTSSIGGATSASINLSAFLAKLSENATDDEQFIFEVQVTDGAELSTTRKVTFRYVAPPEVKGVKNNNTFEIKAPGKVKTAILSVTTTSSDLPDLLKFTIKIDANDASSPYKMDLIEDSGVKSYFGLNDNSFSGKTSANLNFSKLVTDFNGCEQDGSTLKVVLTVTDEFDRTDDDTLEYTYKK